MACCRKSCALLVLLGAVLIGYFWKTVCPMHSTYRVNPYVAEFVGPLTRNRDLDSAQRFLEGVIGPGPESIAVKDGKLYTGTADGKILEITGDKVKVIVKIGGNDCVSGPATDKNACGHPLGVRFDSEGQLVVADGTKGIYKVNVKTGAVTTLVASSTKVDGRAINFADDLAIAKTGEIYFSDALDDAYFFQKSFWQTFFHHKAEGRVLVYDPKTKVTKTVLEKLYFSNGVELSPEEDVLFVSQTLDRSILKYHLKGPKKGQLEHFVANLPGFTDNIRLNERGTYWIAFCAAIDPQDPSLWERITCHITRYYVYSSLELLNKLLQTVYSLAPVDFVKTLHHSVLELLHESVYQGDYGLIVEVNAKGEILRSLHSPKGVVSRISQVTEHQGILYIASYWNGFIGKVKLPK